MNTLSRVAAFLMAHALGIFGILAVPCMDDNSPWYVAVLGFRSRLIK